MTIIRGGKALFRSKPLSVVDLLCSFGVEYTATQNIGEHWITIETSPPLTEKEKEEIIRSAHFYGGPTKVIFKVKGEDNEN